MFKFGKVLYPIDLDHIDSNFVQSVFDFTLQFKSELHIFYVNDSSSSFRTPFDHEDTVSLKVQEIVGSKTLDQQPVIYAVSGGNLSNSVNEYCQANSIDMIITGHQHQSSLFAALFDSADEAIINKVNIPVLVLPKR